MTSSSSILRTIRRIRRNKLKGGEQKDENGPHAYYLYYDSIGRLIYVTADIYPDCLDRGKDLEVGMLNHIRLVGFRADVAMQVINKRFGGRSVIGNCFPLNPKLSFFRT
jgi:hypothetical protein